MKIKRTYLSHAVAAAFLALSTQLAFAVEETEAIGQMGVNDSFSTAQRLTVANDGTVIVDGRIGVTSTTATPIPDVDFYAFEGTAGDGVKLDIDRGMKGVGATERHVDTIIGLWKPGAAQNTWEFVGQINNVSTPDDGSRKEDGGLMDARIPEDGVTALRLQTSGTYIVGVSSNPRFFRPDGTMSDSTVTGSKAPFPNGSYKLNISGLTPPKLMHLVNIDVKPGNQEKAAPLNPKAKGAIRVALLSHPAAKGAPEFKAHEVKRESVRFGRSGEEQSLLRCNKEGLDVNGDGLLDLICFFDNEAIRWEGHETMGKIKGEAGDGLRFEGDGDLKVVPASNN